MLVNSLAFSLVAMKKLVQASSEYKPSKDPQCKTTHQARIAVLSQHLVPGACSSPTRRVEAVVEHTSHLAIFLVVLIRRLVFW